LRKSKFTDSQLLAIFGEGEDGLVLAEMCTQIRKILDHIGVDSTPPHIAPARGPPLWDDCDAQTDEGVHIEPDGVWRHNQHRIARWICSSIGEWLKRRF
jgi:hypothetical protein